MEDLSHLLTPFGGPVGVMSVTSQAGGNLTTDTASASMTAPGSGDYVPEELGVDVNDDSIGKPPFNTSLPHNRTTTGKVSRSGRGG
jgi:hypothetical protein